MADQGIHPGFCPLLREHGSWQISCHEGVQLSPRLNGSNLEIEVTAAKGANWHGELLYGAFPVSRGQIFHISFWAKARHPFGFSVWLGQYQAPFLSLVSEADHFGEQMMESEWKHYSHTWDVARDEAEARLDFVIGRIDNLVEIQNVSLSVE